jgi:hypothetical protein
MGWSCLIIFTFSLIILLLSRKRVLSKVCFWNPTYTKERAIQHSWLARSHVTLLILPFRGVGQKYPLCVSTNSEKWRGKDWNTASMGSRYSAAM